jgi:hypothetical protein
MDNDVIISALGAAIEILLDDGEGIVVDIDEGRFIVGSQDGYMVLNQCKMNECDDEFKNVKAGTIIKMNEIIQYDSQSEVH